MTPASRVDESKPNTTPIGPSSATDALHFSGDSGSETTDDPGRSDARGEEARADAELVRRVGRGDRRALGELYDRHAARAYSLACQLVGAATALDVVHDAFVALIDKPSTFDPARGSFRAWFLTSVHHRCLNHRRAQRPSLPEESLAELAGGEVDPADAVVARLRDRAVRGALLAIGRDQREVLVLAYYGGLTQSALATRLGVPLGTVKARMRRGLLGLRAALRGATNDSEKGGGP
jgi:RNA polymerase sigma-70 factor (ECF subfamily)